MPQPVVTVIDAVVAAEQEQSLVGFRELTEGPQPDGLVRSELLRGQDGAWRIQTTWRDLDTLRELRASNEPPAALELLRRLGVQHMHGVFTVEHAL